MTQSTPRPDSFTYGVSPEGRSPFVSVGAVARTIAHRRPWFRDDPSALNTFHDTSNPIGGSRLKLSISERLKTTWVLGAVGTHGSCVMKRCGVVMVPKAWIVDLDGTLALNAGRNPYQWDRVGEDLPNPPVIMAVQALADHPEVSAIIAVSGRDESSRLQTEMWLHAQDVPFDALHMRQSGDGRADEVVKEGIYRTQIEGRFDIVGVIDDRDKVVDMWRRIGLTCFQVAEGNF